MGIQVMNNSHQSVADQRRTIVARLVLRGMTQREIVESLARQLTNGDGNPWSLATVNRDIKAIRKDWRKEARRDYDIHVAHMLAEYREVRRQAWVNKDYDLVLKVCDRECKLLGLDKPDRLVLTWREEAEAAGVDASEVFEQLVREASVLLDGGDGMGRDS